MYAVYIVECSDGTLYSGWTTDISRRVAEHNSSRKGAKYTKPRRPVSLRHVETFKTKSEAQKREYALKQLSRSDKLTLIKTVKNSERF